ncbi:MAG TPA: PP2C family protein-serine/threonine phosphatase [Terracidiphilus sp.]|nr:PP2C family protein-serine/threonine phosphatase [Terracidiphilus sp.]
MPTARAQKQPVSESSFNVSLGRAVVPLYGPWKFSIGDSPIDPTTGRFLWADPGFDDSSWQTVDLTPAEGAQNPITGSSGFTPGWNSYGHPGVWGWGWYRMRVRVDADPGVALSLAGPGAFDDVYQIFDDGQLIGNFGDFSGSTPRLYYAQPAVFVLPRSASSHATRVLAFRFWMQPQTLTQGFGVGGFESAPTIGESSAIALVHRSQIDQEIRVYLWEPVEAVVFFLLFLLALSLAFFDRSDKVYLWIAALFLATAADATSGTFAVWSTLVHANFDVVSHNFILFSLEYAGWVMIWRLWFRQHRPAWLPWTLIPLVILLSISQAFADNFFAAYAGGPAVGIGHAISLITRLIMASYLFFIVFKGIREQGMEGWLVLPPVLLASVAEFTRELQQLGMQPSWFPFGVQITLAVLTHLLLVAVLAILLVRRLVLSLRRQRLMALDVKQAQEVQRVILPEARAALQGFMIESEYRSAREVGGDFFQVIPDSTGSILVVAGDVAGKGLQAGMLVALLVGAIRSTAESTRDPLALLQALNRRLIGRGEAHATCLALRIEPTGAATLANAGHLPPYLNGQPIAMDGALPLGSLESADFSVTRFTLAPDDRLVLVSDGLAEAQNEQGELFGFARVEELIRSGQSAAELANAVQAFGQEDDISIIALTRTLAASA